MIYRKILRGCESITHRISRSLSSNAHTALNTVVTCALSPSISCVPASTCRTGRVRVCVTAPSISVPRRLSNKMDAICETGVIVNTPIPSVRTLSCHLCVRLFHNGDVISSRSPGSKIRAVAPRKCGSNRNFLFSGVGIASVNSTTCIMKRIIVQLTPNNP